MSIKEMEWDTFCVSFHRIISTGNIAMESKATKPLGMKAYGHIPHLTGSRIGPGDHHCDPGQVRICTEKARDRHDRIIVTEKVDGSNCAVARIDGQILPLNRAGYHALTSKFEHHRMFAEWVYASCDRFLTVLQQGERLCGEWLALAHGTRYKLPHEPFVVFDLMKGPDRSPFDAFIERLQGKFVTPRLIHSGGPISIETVMKLVEPSGHGALDPVEGAVWRVERKGSFDFLAKFVRPDKVDGIYLPEISGKDPVWNWRP